MSQPSFFEEETDPGFRSRESKGRFTAAVVIISVVYFLAQTFLPMIIVFGMMFSQGLKALANIEVSDPQRSCYHEGRVWYLSTDGGINGTQGASLRNFDPKEDIPSIDGPSVPDSELQPLSGEDRLWLISPEMVSYLQNGELKTFLTERSFDEASQPFLHEGVPSLIAYQDDEYYLFHFQDETWVSVMDLEALPNPEKKENEEDFEDVGLSIFYDLYDLRPIASGGRFHLFGESTDNVIFVPDFLKPEQRQGAEQQVVCPVGWSWIAVDFAGVPAVFSKEEDEDNNTVLVGRVLRDGQQWTEIYRNDMSFSAEFGVVPVPEMGRFLVLIRDLGSLKVQTYDLTADNSKVLSTRTDRHGPGLDSNLMMIMMIPYPIVLVLGFFFVGSVTLLMRRYRQPYYAGPLPNVRFASFWGRTCALLFDLLLAYAGYIAIMGWLFVQPDPGTIVENLIESPDEHGTEWMILGGSVLWMMFVFLMTCLTQGLWGVSFGKLLCGIRVVGYDLKPCGIWRALLRNLLLIVDQFCSGMVAGLLIALNVNWQRSGDLASKTIVVATGHWQTELAERSHLHRDELV